MAGSDAALTGFCVNKWLEHRRSGVRSLGAVILYISTHGMPRIQSKRSVGTDRCIKHKNTQQRGTTKITDIAICEKYIKPCTFQKCSNQFCEFWERSKISKVKILHVNNGKMTEPFFYYSLQVFILADVKSSEIEGFPRLVEFETLQTRKKRATHIEINK